MKDNDKNEEKVNCSWANYSDCKRQVSYVDCIHRVGPAPKDEWDAKKSVKAKKDQCNDDHIGSLDCSDFEFDDNKAKFSCDKKEGVLKESNAYAGSRAIIIYFSRMSNAANTEKIDYDFLHSLISNGAAVNVSDKYGQTVMHEVARNWNTDVAKFLISYGGDANHPDRWGRTPLHLAAATNHADMVTCLLSNGGMLIFVSTFQRSLIQYRYLYFRFSLFSLIQ